MTPTSIFAPLLETLTSNPVQREQLLTSLVGITLTNKTSVHSFKTLCDLFSHLSPEDKELFTFKRTFAFFSKTLEKKQLTSQEVLSLFNQYDFIKPQNADFLKFSKYLEEKKPEGYKDIILSLKITAHHHPSTEVVEQVLTAIHEHKDIPQNTLDLLQKSNKDFKTFKIEDKSELSSIRRQYRTQLNLIVVGLALDPHPQCLDILNSIGLTSLSLFKELLRNKPQVVKNAIPKLVIQYDLKEAYEKTPDSEKSSWAKNYIELVSTLVLGFSSGFYSSRYQNILFDRDEENQPAVLTKKQLNEVATAMAKTIVFMRNDLQYDVQTIENFYGALSSGIKHHFSTKDPEDKNPNISALACFFDEGRQKISTKKTLESLLPIQIEHEKEALNNSINNTIDNNTSLKSTARKFKI